MRYVLNVMSITTDTIFAPAELIGVTAKIITQAAALRVPGQAVVIALSGDLGAGKTTLVQYLAKALGVTQTVQSPTFVIMKSYETSHEEFKRLIHMDAYRIKDLSELGPLRFTELLATPQSLFCIEWAEKIHQALPARLLLIQLEIGPNESRLISVTKR